ncbi:IS605 OrfB family transposase [Bacillus fengqiuensis]|nr:IS605 OrfB family transposase [Bacillus fengqiuensis]
MKKAYFSKRIQKKLLNEESIKENSVSIEFFNKAKRFAFHSLIRKKRWNLPGFEPSLHLQTKQKYQLDDYYTNSAVREANALFKSRESLHKLYIEQASVQIKSIKKKIKNEKTKLTKLRKIKTSFTKGSPTFPKNSRFSLQKSGIVSCIHKKQPKTDIWFNPYLFEHQYVDVQIKRLKAKIGRLEHRLFRTEQKKKKLETRIPSVVFGTKKLFKHQYTKEEYVSDHGKWKETFKQKRNKQMIISGRKDAKSGNFVFHYNTETNTLTYTSVTGKVVTFENVEFPYGQKQVNRAVQIQQNCKNKKGYGKPISWSLEDYGSYYIVKCLIDVEENEHINFSTADGVIAVDCNVDHFAVADVSKDGNYLGGYSQHFSIQGKTTGQITKIIEAEVISIVDEAVEKNKPIVIEEIDTTLSKVGDPYGNKKANNLKSMFAYKKMKEAIESRAAKKGVAVIQVNPAYTSISGKMKYMRKLGISIHQSAAFTIGRRGLGYKEKVPKALSTYILNQSSHHWSHWHQLNKRLDVSTNAFYHIVNINKPYRSIDPHQSSLQEEEQKKLSKVII